MSRNSRINDTPVSIPNSSTQLLPIRPTRGNCFIHNPHSTITVYLKASAAATVAGGFPIGPGESMPIGHINAVNAIGDAAGPVSMRVWEEFD